MEDAYYDIMDTYSRVGIDVEELGERANRHMVMVTPTVYISWEGERIIYIKQTSLFDFTWHYSINHAKSSRKSFLQFGNHR